MLEEYLAANEYHQYVDMEDPMFRKMNVIGVYYSDTDLTQMLMGGSRNYFFEMELALVKQFVRLVNEGQRAKSIFQNLVSLFRH